MEERELHRLHQLLGPITADTEETSDTAEVFVEKYVCNGLAGVVNGAAEELDVTAGAGQVATWFKLENDATRFRQQDKSLDDVVASVECAVSDENQNSLSFPVCHVGFVTSDREPLVGIQVCLL